MSNHIIAGSQDAKQLQVRLHPWGFHLYGQLTVAVLQDAIQTELVVRGMSEADDSTMAEYVAVMLSESSFANRAQMAERLSSIVNQKTAGTHCPEGCLSAG